MEEHAAQRAFSTGRRLTESDVIQIIPNQTEYRMHIPALQSSRHFTLTLGFYTFDDMTEEYQVVDEFEEYSSIDFVTPDKFPWIVSQQCRRYGGLFVFNRIEQGVLRLITFFCSDLSFNGCSDANIFNEGLAVQSTNVIGSIVAPFGHFLYAEDENKLQVTFTVEYDELDLSFLGPRDGGFGFITPEFDEFGGGGDGAVLDTDGKKCCIQCIGGFIGIICDLACFTIEHHESGLSKYCQGGFVKVEVDMKEQRGKIFGVGDSEQLLLSVSLPERVAVVVSLNHPLRIHVQKYTFLPR